MAIKFTNLEISTGSFTIGVPVNKIILQFSDENYILSHTPRYISDFLSSLIRKKVQEDSYTYIIHQDMPINNNNDIGISFKHNTQISYQDGIVCWRGIPVKFEKQTFVSKQCDNRKTDNNIFIIGRYLS